MNIPVFMHEDFITDDKRLNFICELPNSLMNIRGKDCRAALQLALLFYAHFSGFFLAKVL